MAGKEKLWREAAVLLIDHQVGTMSWVKSIPLEEMKRNAVMLAKTAKILKLPVGPHVQHGRSCAGAAHARA